MAIGFSFLNSDSYICHAQYTLWMVDAQYTLRMVDAQQLAWGLYRGYPDVLYMISGWA